MKKKKKDKIQRIKAQKERGRAEKSERNKVEKEAKEKTVSKKREKYAYFACTNMRGADAVNKRTFMHA